MGGGGRTGGRRGAKENRERKGCIRREMKEQEMVVAGRGKFGGYCVFILNISQSNKGLN